METWVSEERSHYDVLGLSRDASPEAIRRRFRELARREHPDSNPDPAAHERFLRINEAYLVLGDQARRASYDLLLRDRERRRAEQRRTAGPGGRQQYAAPPRGAGAAAAAAQAREKREREERRQRAFAMLRRAEDCMRRGNLREAAQLCESVLKLVRSGTAHEILGDIAMRQNRRSAALNHYTQAAQLLPGHGLIMAKLNRLVESERGGYRSQRTALGGAGSLSPLRTLARQMSISCIGAAAIVTLAILWRQIESAALGWIFAPNWTLAQLICMLLAGFTAGVVLSTAGWVHRFSDVMAHAAPAGRLRTIPLWSMLSVFSLLLFYLSFVAYLAVALFQEAISGSVLLAFAAAFVVVSFFALAAPPAGQSETLTWGGNLIFPLLLAGWWLGDLLRTGA